MQGVLERRALPFQRPGRSSWERNTCSWALRAAAAAARHRGAKEMWISVKDSKGEFVGQHIFLQNLQRQANTLICNSLRRCSIEEIDLQNLHHHHQSKGNYNQAESISDRGYKALQPVLPRSTAALGCLSYVALGAVTLMVWHCRYRVDSVPSY